jgi:hypothetical protein
MNRIGLEQHERTYSAKQYSSDDLFETIHQPSSFTFDELQGVHAAVSLEATNRSVPYNQCWLYLSVKKQTSDKEYRIITPIAPKNSRRWRFVLTRLFKSPIFDGLDIPETTDFLMACIANKRKDLFAMCGRVNDGIIHLHSRDNK